MPGRCFFLQLPLSSCVVSKKLVQVTPACITITDNTVHILIFGKEWNASSRMLLVKLVVIVN